MDGEENAVSGLGLQAVQPEIAMPDASQPTAAAAPETVIAAPEPPPVQEQDLQGLAGPMSAEQKAKYSSFWKQYRVPDEVYWGLDLWSSKLPWGSEFDGCVQRQQQRSLKKDKVEQVAAAKQAAKPKGKAKAKAKAKGRPKNKATSKPRPGAVDEEYNAGDEQAEEQEHEDLKALEEAEEATNEHPAAEAKTPDDKEADSKESPGGLDKAVVTKCACMYIYILI